VYDTEATEEGGMGKKLPVGCPRWRESCRKLFMHEKCEEFVMGEMVMISLWSQIPFLKW
jgi:hypothetical protein